MTILQLISSGGFYGAESMLVSLAASLEGLGCASKVAVLRDTRDPHTEVAERAAQSGLETCSIPCAGRWDWNAVGKLREVVDRLGADVVHTHGYKADFYALAARRTSRRRLVATCHNWPDPRLLMQSYAVLDRLALRRFDCVATPSEAVAETLRRSGIRPERLHAIPNGVDVRPLAGTSPSLRRELGCGGAPLIGFVGRLVNEKGGEDLIRAARAVVSAIPEAHFVFAGAGPAGEAWIALASSLGLNRSVHFLGARDDMPAVYASLDALALPSYVEALPMCLLEAMAAAVPVVATAVGAVPSLVAGEEAGILVQPGDVDGLAAALLRLLNDRGLARKLGGAARERVIRDYSSEAMARRYLGLYQPAAGMGAPLRDACRAQEAGCRS
jgi:glycosyltransferase involved in cell wall biosynthesis